jgi:NAD(P)-dependent dehydrogenase (short-subunit alcohol dehydrogenase family)
MGFSADTLRGQVAIVTGASQGIGRAIACEFAGVGAHVVACSRRPAELEAVAALIRERGGRARAVTCDVGEASQVAQLVTETHQAFGRIDILVNNAAYRTRGPLEQLPIPEWDAMVRCNLTGVFLCSQAVGRIMIGQGAGVIINITSVAGRYGSRGMAAYAATKAGVTVFTQSLGAEWAKYGIRVNAIAPGAVETEGALAVWKTPEMVAGVAREIPLRRLGRPEEIARAAVFLASDQSSFTTGETLYVSGGPKTSGRED